MTKSIYVVMLFVANHLDAQQYQLTAPQLSAEKIWLYEDSTTTVRAGFAMIGAEIKYTIKNSKGKVMQSGIYREPISPTCEGVMEFTSHHKDYLASEPKTLMVIQGSRQSFDLKATAPHEKYKAQTNSLTDHQLGDSNFHQDYWGYNGIDPEFEINATQALHEVALSFYCNQNAWIFGPDAIMVYDKDGKEIASQTFEHKKESSSPYIIVSLPLEGSHHYVRIKVKSLAMLPEWHPGKGEAAWLFLDEVMVK